MMEYSIYIVDDEETIREGLTMALQEIYLVSSYPTAEAALEAMKENPPDLVLLDIGLPGMSGIDAMSRMKDIAPDLLIVMITAYEDVDTVVSAMKRGAHDYVVKPIQPDSLEVTIRNALETIRLRKEVHALQERYLKENIPCFVGESDAIQHVIDFMKKVADSPDTPILILGETGTGKELIASAIHYRSPNYKGSLVTVNCPAIPKNLIESELFGYERGAFTGARTSGKKGLIDEAEGGTLFLDEVGDLSLEAQAKLLRFLEDGEFYRVGGTKTLRVKTRVVSATNRDLEDMIEKDLFRKDLYYRLGVIKVQVPSLNERRDDIIPLAMHFLEIFSQKFGKEYTGIADEAESTLKEYEWVGNVRELKNLIERAVLIGHGPEMTVEELGIGTDGAAEENERRDPGFQSIPPEGIDFPDLRERMEEHYIREAIRMADGNESKAAKLLNMNHHTFRYHRKKNKIE